jgi:hypothetical protein
MEAADRVRSPSRCLAAVLRCGLRTRTTLSDDTFRACPTAAARLPWGVAALLLATGDALAARFGAVSVRGELSGFNRAASGHCYFALKDADGAPALLRCAMFRRAAGLVDFAPADGQQVELRGRLGVYEARGELQMIVESLQRVGSGALYEEFLRRGHVCRPRVFSTVPANGSRRLIRVCWAW